MKMRYIIFLLFFMVFAVLLTMFFLPQKSLVFGAIEYNVTSTPGEFWAWNDLIGWIDFYNFGNTKVSSEGLKGYASSSFGNIWLYSETSPYSNNSTFRVTMSEVGKFNGYAWNDVFGWLGFNVLGFGNYRARVLVNSRNEPDTPPSDFEQWAWNPVVGFVSFNCKDITWTSTTPNAYCNATSSYKVATDWYSSSTQGWLESAVFDTGVVGGAKFNSITWRGEKPLGTSVKFEFAAALYENGPWNYEGPFDTETTSLNPDSKSYSAKFDFNLFNNARYFKYKIILISNTSQTLSPVVEEVIVNWSP